MIRTVFAAALALLLSISVRAQTAVAGTPEETHAVAGPTKRVVQLLDQGETGVNDLPDAPKGRYAAAIFDTAFERATVEEKVILRQQGTQWLLVGYFLSKKYSASQDPKQ